MRKKIVVEHGDVNEISRLMGCTRQMVNKSLSYRKNTDLAKRIRKMAIMRGGQEVCFGEPKVIQDVKTI
ncbi:MAG: ArsR family transcriptional regulator [Parabacteroides sp.]